MKRNANGPNLLPRLPLLLLRAACCCLRMLLMLLQV